MKNRLIAATVAGILMTAGTALAGDSVKIKGEIIDTSCYAISGAKGEGHRQCAQGCIKKGSPAGLLETGTDKVYVLIPKKPMTSLPKGVMAKVGHDAEITGKVFTTGGSQFLTVESIK
jgi:type 1 fimbria pilin